MRHCVSLFKGGNSTDRCVWRIEVQPGERVIGRFKELRGWNTPSETEPATGTDSCATNYIQMTADLEHQMAGKSGSPFFLMTIHISPRKRISKYPYSRRSILFSLLKLSFNVAELTCSLRNPKLLDFPGKKIGLVNENRESLCL